MHIDYRCALPQQLLCGVNFFYKYFVIFFNMLLNSYISLLTWPMEAQVDFHCAECRGSYFCPLLFMYKQTCTYMHKYPHACTLHKHRYIHSYTLLKKFTDFFNPCFKGYCMPQNSSFEIKATSFKWVFVPLGVLKLGSNNLGLPTHHKNALVWVFEPFDAVCNPTIV